MVSLTQDTNVLDCEATLTLTKLGGLNANMQNDCWNLNLEVFQHAFSFRVHPVHLGQEAPPDPPAPTALRDLPAVLATPVLSARK